MSKFWSPMAAALDPYVPGEQPKDKRYIKLNTNENPYPPSPKAIAAMEKAINADLRLYPDPNSSDLVATLAKAYDLEPNQVFVGNGSDEVLAFTFATFFDPAKEVLFPDITYSFYKVYANFYSIKPRLIPINDQFEIDVNDYVGEHGGIILPNPNAPTANALPLSDIETLLKNNPDQVVVIDEAYVDFGAESATTLVNKYNNLLVVHTLSKSRSLAGIRVGFAFGSPELIEGLNRTKNSFNSYTIDRLAMAGAIASIEDKAYFNETNAKVIATRETLTTKLQELGFKSTNSMANFVFVTHPQFEAANLLQQLRDRGILVRYFSAPRINNYLRISIGTDEEMNELVKVLTDLVAVKAN